MAPLLKPPPLIPSPPIRTKQPAVGNKLPPRPRTSSRSLSPSPRNRSRTLSMDPLKDLERQLQTSIQQKGHGHADTAALYNEMGNMHFRQGNRKAANDSYQQAILCHPTGPHAATAYMNLGTVYWSSGDAESALQVLQKSLDCSSSDEISPQVASVHHQMGLCHALQQDFLKAMHCMKNAYNIRKALNKTTDVAKTLDAMGKICYMQGELDAAIKHHELAYHLLNLTNAPTLNVLKNMAAAYEALGKDSKAIAIWKDLAEHFRLKPGATAHLQATLSTISRLYEKAGNQTQAFAYRQEALHA